VCGERAVGGAALAGRGSVVGGTAQERVAEAEPAARQRHDADRLGCLERGRVQRQLGERGQDRHDQPGHRGGSDDERPPCVAAEVGEAFVEGALDDRPGLEGLAQRRSTGQLVRAHHPGQLEQRERVARGVCREPVDDPIRDRSGSRVGEQGARCLDGQARRLELGQLRPFDEGRDRVARREKEADGVRVETAADEDERVERSCVEPVRVVDAEQQRSLLGGGRDQAQRRDGHGEAVVRDRRAERERAGEDSRLSLRQLLEARQERPEELQQASEGQRCLGLDAAVPEDLDSALLGCVTRVVGERGLADPGLAVDQQCRRPPRAHPPDELVDPRTLGGTAEERHVVAIVTHRGRPLKGAIAYASRRPTRCDPMHVLRSVRRVAEGPTRRIDSQGEGG
jgi:hypothetical protein